MSLWTPPTPVPRRLLGSNCSSCGERPNQRLAGLPSPTAWPGLTSRDLSPWPRGTVPISPAHRTPRFTLGNVVFGHQHTETYNLLHPAAIEQHACSHPGFYPPSPPSGQGRQGADLTSVSREAAGRLSQSGSWSWVWGWIPEGWLWDRAWGDTRGASEETAPERLHTPGAPGFYFAPVTAHGGGEDVDRGLALWTDCLPARAGGPTTPLHTSTAALAGNASAFGRQEAG